MGARELNAMIATTAAIDAKTSAASYWHLPSASFIGSTASLERRVVIGAWRAGMMRNPAIIN